MRVGRRSGRQAASATEAGSGPSAEKTPGAVTKPPSTVRSAPVQSGGSQSPAGTVTRKIFPCARDCT